MALKKMFVNGIAAMALTFAVTGCGIFDTSNENEEMFRIKKDKDGQTAVDSDALKGGGGRCQHHRCRKWKRPRRVVQQRPRRCVEPLCRFRNPDPGSQSLRPSTSVSTAPSSAPRKLRSWMKSPLIFSAMPEPASSSKATATIADPMNTTRALGERRAPLRQGISAQQGHCRFPHPHPSATARSVPPRPIRRKPDAPKTAAMISSPSNSESNHGFKLLRRRGTAPAFFYGNDMKPSADEIAQALGLEKHVEGGMFRELFRSVVRTHATKQRRAATSIFYLLRGNEVSRWHMVKSDEIWMYHAGSPAVQLLLLPDGTFEERIVGPDVLGGEFPQSLVPAWTWQSTVSSGTGPNRAGDSSEQWSVPDSNIRITSKAPPMSSSNSILKPKTAFWNSDWHDGNPSTKERKHEKIGLFRNRISGSSGPAHCIFPGQPHLSGKTHPERLFCQRFV